MNYRRYFNIVLISISFFVAGILVGRTSKGVQANRELSTYVAIHKETVTLSNNRPSLASQTRSLENNPDKPLAKSSFVGPPDALYDKIFGNASFYDVFPNNSLSNEICECLAINPAERASIDSLLQNTTFSVKAEQRANMQILRSGEETTDLVIKKFAVTGSLAKQNFLDEVGKVIGFERRAILSRIAMKALNECYLGFGQSDVSISVTQPSSKQSFEVTIKSDGIARMFDSKEVPDVLKGLMEFE